MFNLHEYQQDYLNDIERGKKNLIHLATGGGKSFIFKQFIYNELQQKIKCLFIVSGKSILAQAVKKHFDFLDANKISLMMGSKKYSMTDVLCCSIDTLSRRDNIHNQLLSDYQTIVVDEAHDATAQRYLNFLNKVTSQTVVGLTATPYLVGKKGHTYWDKVIKKITVAGLVKKGFLVKPRIFASKIQMNTKVKTTAGDYNNKALYEANDEMSIYGSIIKEYIEKGNGKKAVAFAININHSKQICQTFNDYGIKAVHADAETDMDERAKILYDFEHGDTQVLCNVNIFSTGIDVPIAEVGIMARPTKSKIVWIQQAGRLLRTHPGKEFAIILDHGGNAKRIGHLLEDFEAEILDKDLKKNDELKTSLYQCEKCWFIYSEKQVICSNCGFDNQKAKKEREIKAIEEARLEEIKLEIKTKNELDQWLESICLNPGTIGTEKMCRERDRLINIVKNGSAKKNFIFYKMYEKYREDAKRVLKFPFWFNN